MLKLLLVLILLAQVVTWQALPEVALGRQYSTVVIWPCLVCGVQVRFFAVAGEGRALR